VPAHYLPKKAPVIAGVFLFPQPMTELSVVSSLSGKTGKGEDQFNKYSTNI
jgi:hypothetical protein